MDKENLKSLLKKEWKFSFIEKISNTVTSFSATEKAVFFFFAVILITSGLSLLYQVNKNYLIEVPDYGGSLTEGVVGSARFINPLLANSDADKDLTSLLYSGLLKLNEEGGYAVDLAENYEISSDGLTYTVRIKDDARFHDGIKVTADDIIYTIERVQDPELKSPKEANWMGVKVQKINESEVQFTLKQPFSNFIQNLTLGILPKHIWRTANVNEFPFSQFNTKPVGSGPYQISHIVYTDSGLPQEYRLKSFKKYTLGRPYIDEINIKSFQNEKDLLKAWEEGDIESFNGISPKVMARLSLLDHQVVLGQLTRIFGLFLNQNSAQVLLNKEVREALNTVIDKEEMVQNILGGYGMAIDDPVPEKISLDNFDNSSSSSGRIEAARNILTKAGWKQNGDGIFEKKDKKGTKTLSFSISTGDAPELKESAELLEKQWKDLGVGIDVKIFDIGDLNQNIIKPRKYDALLFGEIVDHGFDLYPFWHSSQRNSPGLNIAMYTSLKADKLMENIRKSVDPVDREKDFKNLKKEIKNDRPAIFTYSPYFIYVVPKKVKNVSLGTLVSSQERFNNVTKWYIETNNVWEVFNRQPL